MPKCVFCERENSATTIQCQHCGSPLPIGDNQRLEETIFRARLLELLKNGEKTNAITAYQRQYGATLIAAVEFIDGLNKDQEFSVPCSIADVEWEVGKLLERGEKAKAIKFYWERTGVELQVAKAEVDAIENRLGLEPDQRVAKTGCIGMILLLGASTIWITNCIVMWL